MDIMAARNLDNTGCGCQTLLDDPKLLGRGPPPSPLRTRQNRNRRHVLLICLQINEQTISRSNTVQEGGPYRGLTSRRHDDEVQFYAFDILAEGGEDLRKLPLSMHKTNLARLLC
jgi:hypothetical protein